jgi:hypothetical protein
MKREQSILISAYQGLKVKYLHNKELATCLIGGIIGANWRADVEKFTPRVKGLVRAENKIYRPPKLRNVTPEMLDWYFTHIDNRNYQDWSVYHLGWEWLKFPDEYGFGAFKTAWQEIPGVQGRGFHTVFATWDSPAYCLSFEPEHEYAIVFSFWDYVGGQQPFKLWMAYLPEWWPAPDGGVEVALTVLGLEGPKTAEIETCPLAVRTHDNEEYNNWDWAIPELARRKGFDPSTYRPQWKVGRPEKREFDINLILEIKLFSDEELEKMDVRILEKAVDVLWQRNLAQSMVANYLLHYYGDHPELTRPNYMDLYDIYKI